MGKIDKNELRRLLQEGKGVSECARHFGVSPAAVSKAKKSLGRIVAKDVQLETVHRFVNEHLDTVAQLRKLNDNAHELLDTCMRWLRGEDEALQVLESQVRKVRVGRGEDAQELTEYRFKDPREIALRAMGEIRGQLKLQNETLAMLAEVKAVHEFQQELIQILREVDASVADEFCRRIDQRQALRRAIRVDPQGA
ncbi:MAG: hypothetical protein JRJ03_08785 [Deltaproteobacteria bacterium]|nr:hypothetical protein [Deltaproteobacteria bacterium]